MVLALLAGGIGLPVPEELALLAGGHACWRGGVAAPKIFIAAVAAVLAGDLTLYSLGRLFGRVGAVRRLLGDARLGRLERGFCRHGAKLIVAARFVPGLRSTMLVAAGTSRMPLARFGGCDAIAAAVSVALWLSLARLPLPLERVRHFVDGSRTLLLAAGALLVVVGLGRAAMKLLPTGYAIAIVRRISSTRVAMKSRRGDASSG